MTNWFLRIRPPSVKTTVQIELVFTRTSWTRFVEYLQTGGLLAWRTCRGNTDKKPWRKISTRGWCGWTISKKAHLPRRCTVKVRVHRYASHVSGGSYETDFMTICTVSYTSAFTDRQRTGRTHRSVGNADEYYQKCNFSDWCGWLHTNCR